MGKISGLGGIVKVAGSPNILCNNAEYEVETEEVIDEVTTSANTAMDGLPIIPKVNSCVLQLIDSDADPGANADLCTALGLTEGAVVTLYFKRGANAQWNSVVGTIVRNIRYSNPQTKARRLTVTTEYGVLNRNVAAPT